jgi:asparagine synthase (glutamine-hydrolysing)
MCGILGYLNHKGAVNRDTFDRMLSTLSQRGPDGQGTIFLEHERIALGHRRLSIIDLSDTGNQPMTNEDGSIWLTFNGEIYNYKDLRQRLEQKGHILHSNSDSETLIHAYEEWGEACVHYLQGIFAFGLFDGRNKILFLARDHFGVKPLYYFSNEDRFIFASQPKAILAADGFRTEIDRTAFSLYLGYGNVPAEFSIYKGVKKLLPGHLLILKDGKQTLKKYWALEYKPVINDLSTAEEVVREKVRKSVLSQTISDVPVGTLLSGGIDSTIVTSLLAAQSGAKLSSFSVGFREEVSDERQYARLAADTFQTAHHEYLLTYEEACRSIPGIVEAYDEPFHLNGLFPYYALSKLVKSHNIKVVLGGDGADEIFAGYLWYEQFVQDPRLQTRHSGVFGSISSFFSDGNLERIDSARIYFGYNGFLTSTEQENVLGQEFDSVDVDHSGLYQVLGKHWRPDLPSVLSAQLLDVNCFLADHCLPKVDRASMACGVEVRVPFLDVELAETVFSINHELVFQGQERKALLKRAMQSSFPAAMDTSRKKGFSSPMGHWLENGMASSGYSLVLNGGLCQSGLLNTTYLRDNFHFMDVGKQLLLISAELWFQRWMNNETDLIEDFSMKLVHVV